MVLYLECLINKNALLQTVFLVNIHCNYHDLVYRQKVMCPVDDKLRSSDVCISPPILYRKKLSSSNSMLNLLVLAYQPHILLATTRSRNCTCTCWHQCGVCLRLLLGYGPKVLLT